MNARRSLFCVAGLMAGSLALWSVSSALADEPKGHCKVYPLSGPPIEGDVVDLGDEYQITVTYPGKNGKPDGKRVQKIAKTQVSKIETITPAGEGAANAGQASGFRVPITDAMIQEILGSDNLDVSTLDTEDAAKVDVLGKLDLDQISRNDMMRIAGPKAKELPTDHFIFVYTSELSKAKEQAANLERVYRWVVKFNELMGVKSIRPDHKLEIFFFGSQKEYDAYLAFRGTPIRGTAGVYMHDVNRSAFYDLMQSEDVLQLKEALKNAPADERRRIENRITRLEENYNLRVVQHEAAHHIHFNIGVFPKKADLPRWVVEGLAQMFEMPAYDSGAKLGTTNYYALWNFRRFYGEKGERLPDMKVVILNDRWWSLGAPAYSMGWALNHYLLKKHKDQYAKWMQHLANLEENQEWTMTDRQAIFEELFGQIDDDWTKAFAEYMSSLELKKEGFD